MVAILLLDRARALCIPWFCAGSIPSVFARGETASRRRMGQDAFLCVRAWETASRRRTGTPHSSVLARGEAASRRRTGTPHSSVLALNPRLEYDRARGCTWVLLRLQRSTEKRRLPFVLWHPDRAGNRAIGHRGALNSGAGIVLSYGASSLTAQHRETEMGFRALAPQSGGRAIGQSDIAVH